MKIHDLLANLPLLERERLRGQIEGMEMAMRICRNRTQDLVAILDNCKTDESRELIAIRMAYASEAAVCIRQVQVKIGNGAMKFGPMTAEEREEIDRIY